RHCRPDHPERDLHSVDGRREACLERRGLLVVFACQISEVAVARELPQLARAVVAVDGGADAVRLVEAGQLSVLLVDRSEVEGGLVPGEVEVVLLVDRSEEAVRLLAVVVQLAGGRYAGHPGSPRIPACRRSRSGPSGRPSSSTSPTRCRRLSTGRMEP